MGFQHLPPEERSRMARKGARTLWDVSEDGKLELLRNSFHSEEAKENSRNSELRVEGIKSSWDSLSPEGRKARVEAAADGVRRVSGQKSKSMTRYWAGKSCEERYQHYLNSFGSDEAGRVRAIAMQKVWDGYSEEEKRERIDRTLNSEESRRHWKETYEALSEEEKRRWVKVHLRGKQHEQTEPERFLESYLNEEHPGEYRYIGTSREVSIGGKYPDFINVNGKKEVLEIFGAYWHLLDRPEELVAHYKKYGFSCKVLWDYECLPEDIERILGG